MILVTGAAGKTGRAIIRTLVAQGAAVRALVRRPEQVRWLEELGVQEVVVADLRDRAAVDRAARGGRAIYHICPNMIPDEVTVGQNIIASGRAAGVAHFVYHSVLHPQVEAMPHHWQKMRVEEHLFASGLAYTILQPSPYMQNVLAGWDQIAGQAAYPVPYSVDTRLGMVDLNDVAAAAAAVFTQPGHSGAVYELAGPHTLTQTEVAAILSQHLGHTVRAVTVPLEQWRRNARAAGLGDYQIEALVKMFRYYDACGFWGNPKVLTWLLGRPPTAFSSFVERTVCRLRTEGL